MKSLRAGLVLLLALALALVAQPSRAAESPATAGWWWFPQQAPAAAPGPSYVAAGDLLVEGTPAQQTAVAAVRLPVPQGATATSLVLAIRSSRGTPALLACPVLSGWAPAQVGTWTFRPGCGGPDKPMVVSADGTTLSVPIAGLLQNEVADVLLSPAPGAATSVTLAAPTAAALHTTYAGAAPVPAPAPAPAPAVTKSPAVEGSQPPPPLVVVAPALPGVAVPPVVTTPPSTSSPPELAAPIAPAAALPAHRTGDDTRTVAVILLALMAVTCFVLGRVPPRPPRALVAVASAYVASPHVKEVTHG